ncbi:protein RRP5 homolog [Styela clava]
MDEILFPRGKAKREPSTFKKKGAKRQAAVDSLFSEGSKSSTGGHFTKEKKKPKEKDEIIKSHGIKDVDGLLQGMDEINVDFLHCKRVQEGTLLLGCIREIQELQLVVGIPHCNTGQVQANHISDIYTSQIRKHLEQDSEQLTPLSDMFQVGDIVVCSVVNPTGITTLHLTLQPSVVNKYLSTMSFFVGQMISGAVKSEEDHGYTIDIGKNDVNAFIPTGEIGARKLKLGAVIRFVITSIRGEGTIVLLSLDEKKIEKSLLKLDNGVSLDTLQPGMVGMFHPTKKLKPGVVGKFLDFNASVCALDCDMSKIRLEKDDFDKNFGKKKKRKTTKGKDQPEKERIDKRIKGCILYVNPITKHVSLSTNHFLFTNDTRLKMIETNMNHFPRGHKCSAKVTKCINGLGAMLMIGESNGTRAFCPMKYVSDAKITNFTEVIRKGDSFPALVLHSSSLDGAVILSLKKSMVEREFLTYDSITPGTVMDCTISGIFDSGLVVTLGTDAFTPVKGFVPKIHMADIILNHPEKKFSKGDVISCKVLYVDKAAGRIHLTHKRTLLKSRLPTIVSYDQLEPGCIAHGYIASIKPYGVFVNFYNNVHGIVRNSELSAELVEDPEKIFFVGQVMKCRLLSCDLEAERASFSFILRPKPKDKKEDHTSVSNISLVNLEVVNKIEGGFEVVVCDDDKQRDLWTKGFLPLMHLSDFPSLAHSWYEIITPHTVLEDCLPIGKKKQPIFTKKNSFVGKFKSMKENAEDNANQTLTFSDLKEDLITPGFVHHIAEYGVFVQVYGGLLGLCPKSKMADRYLLTSDGYYQEGQSVVAKIVEMDMEKRRFIVSLKVSDCPQEQLTADYLKELTDIMRSCSSSWPKSVAIGKQMKVHLTSKPSENGVAMCSSSLFPENYKCCVIDIDTNEESTDVNAALLDVNPVSKCITLSANSKLLGSTVKHNNGTVLKATVAYMNEDVSTVFDLENAYAGLLLNRTHPNHPIFENLWPWKQHDSITVTVCKPINQANVVSATQTSHNKKHFTHGVKRQREESECSDVSLQGDINFGNLQVGQKVEGTIRSVRMNTILVRFTESELEGGYRGQPVTGRLHISEIEHKHEHGAFSKITKYRPWDKLKCNVIGFRDVRTHRYLAITNRNARRCVPELSLLDSPVGIEFEDLKIGQCITAFSHQYVPSKDEIHVEITPAIKGFLPTLLLSDNPMKILKSSHKFKKPVVLHCIVHKLMHNTVTLAGKGAMIDRKTQKDVTELNEDCITNGKICKIFPSNMIIKLPKGGVGKVHITQSADVFATRPFEDFEVSQVVRCSIVSCGDRKSLALSLRKSRLAQEYDQSNIKDKEISEAKEIHSGQILRGFVKIVSNSGVFVSLSRTITGRVDMTKISKYFIKDTSLIEEVLKEGTLVTCKVIEVSKMEGKVSLSLLEGDTGLPDLIPEALGLPQRHGKPKEQKRKEVGLLVDKIEGRKRRKKQKEETGGTEEKRKKTDDIDSGLEEESPTLDTPPRYLSNVSQHEDSVEDPGFSWESINSTSAKETSDSMDSSDDDDNAELSDEKVVNKKSKREIEAEKDREEADLRTKEEEMLEDNAPQTALDWDKLVLASPQNSMLWVSYMAFHLRATEVEKARVVAERALKVIDFHEEKEKWNVWAALLNLETRFGSSESLTKVIDTATQHNDPLKVNFHMVSTFERLNKFDNAEELCSKIVRKFKRNKSAWILYISHLMQRGKREKANEVFKRCLQSLEKNVHLEIISKYAQLEYKCGDTEQGRVLFENALSNYPKRADIWSVYIDMLIKVDKLEDAREVFERVTTLNLSTKNMRSFFKRYIDFETKYGSDESVAEVKQKALDYIESKTNDMVE